MLVIAVGYVHKRVGIVTAFAAIVDFKLYTDKQIALSVEDRRGLVIVAFNATVTQTVIARGTVVTVGILIVTGIIFADQTTAIGAVNEVVLIAVVAEGVIVFTDGIAASNALSAVLAENGLFFKAILAHGGFVHVVGVFIVERFSAKFAFCHFVSPLCSI